MSMIYRNMDERETTKDKAKAMIDKNGRLTLESRANILKAAMALDSVCDGAVSDDAQGFNGGDALFFKPYLSMERQNGIKADYIIVEMYMKLRKYKMQLEGFGINYDDLKLEFQGRETQDSNKTAVKEKQKVLIRESWKAFIMPFGKHKGKSMAQLAEENIGYLQWIAENQEFNNKEVKAAAFAVVSNKEIGATASQSSDLILSMSGSRINIRFPYNEELVNKVKELSVRKFEDNETGKYWSAPLNNVDEVIEKFPNAKISDELKQFIADRKLLQSKARAMSTEAEFELDGFGNGKSLLPFQKSCLEFLEIAKGRALIADEMGLGKTIEIISYLQLHKEARPVVIVCPASLKLNWRNECNGWLDTGDKIQVIKQGKIKPLTENVIIINYDMLGKYKESLIQMNPQILIFDESHMLKNIKAQRTKAAQEIAKNVPMVLLATGTPVLNKPKELYSQLNIINERLYPDNGFFNFGKKFCGGKEISIGFNKTAWDFNGATNIKELALELQAIMIRRVKEDVLKELPDKRRVPMFFELDNRSDYNAVERELEEIKDIIKDLYIEYQLTHSHDIQKEIEMMRGQLLGGIERLSQIVVEGKIKNAIEWIQTSFVDTGTKVVIFGTHIKTLDALEEKFKDVSVRIDGSTPMIRRQEAVDRFQKDPNVLVFLGNIKAAGVGLTLTASSNVVFLEIGWTPADHDQAEDRCIAQGQLIHVLDKGLIPIENVCIGDKVLTHTGKWQKVIKTSSREHRGLMTEITYTRFDEPLLCTHDHKIFVKRGDNYPLWMYAHQILPGDFLVMPRPITNDNLNQIQFPEIFKHSSYQVNQFGAKQINGRCIHLPEVISISDDLLYLFGWYLAEGFSSTVSGKGRFVSLSGHEKEIDILNKLGKQFDLLGIKWSIYRNEKKHGIELRAYSIELAYWFKEWFGFGCYDKKIPELLMNLPYSQTLNLLNGYIDGDGYKRRNQVEWVTVSNCLASQIGILALKCGYSPTLRKIKDGVNGGQWIGGYTINGNSPKKHLSQNDNEYVYNPVNKVSTFFAKQNTQKQIVYDLTVEEDHSFIVGQAIVHNCHRITQKNAVSCYYTLTEDTIEEYKMRLLEDKRGVSQGVVSDDKKLRFNLFESIYKLTNQ